MLYSLKYNCCERRRKSHVKKKHYATGRRGEEKLMNLCVSLFLWIWSNRKVVIYSGLSELKT